MVYSGEFTPQLYSIAASKGSFVESLSDRFGDNYLHNAALRYRAASGLDVGADYTAYKNRSKGFLKNEYSDDTQTSFDVPSGQKIDRLHAYADMSHAFEQGWQVNYGAKGAWAADTDYQYYRAAMGDVETLDTDSRLTEFSTELYGGFSKNWAKGSISASLIGEYYNLAGEERWPLYLQTNFMWMFALHHIVQANVSSNKTYPSYWMLQEAINYVGGYTEVHGHPYLRPMRDYSTQLIYILKQRYIFNVTNNLFSRTQCQLSECSYPRIV